MDGFHDQEALDALTEQVIDALRPIGVTVAPEAVQFGIMQGAMVVALQGLVRPEAQDRVGQDQETKAEFNKMLAEENRMKQEEEKQKIAHLSDDPEALTKFLFEGDSGECSHERTHEGLCLDCHQTMKDQ